MNTLLSYIRKERNKMILKLFINNVLLCSIFFVSSALLGMGKVNQLSKSHLFTLQTLLSKYPELRGRTIAITDRERKEGFTAYQSSNSQGQVIDGITVPYGHGDIIKAERFKQNGTCISPRDVYVKLAALGYLHIVHAIAGSKQRVDIETQLLPILYSCLEGHGFACSGTSLDLWCGILQHEGAHLLHRDTGESMEDALSQLKKSKKLAKRQIVDTLEKIIPLLKKYCILEYRADQEVINREQNPAVLKALSNFYHNLHSFDEYLQLCTEQTLADRIDFVFGPHPALLDRAAYFAYAALELEKKQSRLKS